MKYFIFILFALVAGLLVGYMLCQQGEGTTTPTTVPPDEVKVTITFSGLVAFAHDSNNKLHALVVDAREEQQFGNATIPAHVPFIAVYPGTSTSPTPHYPPLFLDGEEIEIRVNNSTVTHNEGTVLDLLPNLSALQPNVGGINPNVFDTVPPPGMLAGRIKLDQGVLKRHRKPRKLPVTFVSMDNFAPHPDPTIEMPDSTVDVVYEITAQSVNISRKPFGPSPFPLPPKLTLDKGEWNILVGNYPVGDAELPGHNNNTQTVDTYFAVLYELASSPIPITDRMVPLFDVPPGKIGSSPECVPGRFP